MARAAVQVVAGAGVLSLTVLSAILAKERFGVPLARVEVRELVPVANPGAGLGASVELEAAEAGDRVPFVSDVALLSPDAATAHGGVPGVELSDDVVDASEIERPLFEAARGGRSVADLEAKWGSAIYDPKVRWFNGRPARPARVIWMTVTAYSPDERSCGDSADGLTATLHSVTTNGHRLVAADPKVLPYGSMLTVPGYGRESIVPVLDCGGAIKGRRLDVLFPTHEQARAWGVRRLPITVWEFVDGRPRENPRALR